MLVRIGSLLWGTPTVLLFLFCGVYFTYRLHFLQITGIKEMLAVFFGSGKKKNSKGISSFESMWTALAASIGTGNIVGVCAAITAGGPGAVLWMCLSAFFSEATAYVENYLGVFFRETDVDGTIRGGAMYTLKNGLSQVFSAKVAERMGLLYACLNLLSAFGMGNAVQVNATANALHDAFGIPFYITGLVCTVFVCVLFYKGRTAVVKLTSVIVPFGCVAFFAFCGAVLVSQYKSLPSVMILIFRTAFGFRSMTAGFSAQALRRAILVGVRRAIFSNEAGLGTSVSVHAAADHTTPHEQGLRSMAEVCLDTILMCSLTAVCVLCVPNATSLPPENMFVAALQSRFGTAAGKIVAGSLSLFAFSTLLGWSFFGLESAHYVFGKKGELPFSFLFCAVSFFGSMASFEGVWEFSDIINALLAIPNLMSLLLLSDHVVKQEMNKNNGFVIDKLKKRD